MHVISFVFVLFFFNNSNGSVECTQIYSSKAFIFFSRGDRASKYSTKIKDFQETHMLLPKSLICI